MSAKDESAACCCSDNKHCVAVCNATIGLQILIKAIGLSEEVILPSFTFVATSRRPIRKCAFRIVANKVNHWLAIFDPGYR
jgi:dTDP-4-amino-4,6-dideoxygalactose transaminase